MKQAIYQVCSAQWKDIEHNKNSLYLNKCLYSFQIIVKDTPMKSQAESLKESAGGTRPAIAQEILNKYRI